MTWHQLALTLATIPIAALVCGLLGWALLRVGGRV